MALEPTSPPKLGFGASAYTENPIQHNDTAMCRWGTTLCMIRHISTFWPARGSAPGRKVCAGRSKNPELGEVCFARDVRAGIRAGSFGGRGGLVAWGSVECARSDRGRRPSLIACLIGNPRFETSIFASSNDQARHARHAVDAISGPQLPGRTDDDLADRAEYFIGRETIGVPLPLPIEAPIAGGHFVEASLIQDEPLAGEGLPFFADLFQQRINHRRIPIA